LWWTNHSRSHLGPDHLGGMLRLIAARLLTPPSSIGCLTVSKQTSQSVWTAGLSQTIHRPSSMLHPASSCQPELEYIAQVAAITLSPAFLKTLSRPRLHLPILKYLFLFIFFLGKSGKSFYFTYFT
jgi:hypothetical protein